MLMLMLVLVFVVVVKRGEERRGERSMLELMYFFHIFVVLFSLRVV